MTKDKDKKVPVLRFKGFTDDWEQRKLSQVFYVNGRIGFRGYTRKDITNKAQGGIWAISPINIRDNRLIFSHKNTYITKTKYDESPEIKLHSTYSLLVKTGSTLGKSAYVSELYEPATINPQVVVLKPINKPISKYLSYMLITNSFLQQISALKIGGAIPTLTESDLKNIKLYTVSCPREANKISTILGKLDTIVSLQQRKLKLIKQIETALSSQIFSKINQKSNLRFQNFSDEWERCELQNIARVISGGTPSTKNNKFWNGNINWYSPTEIGTNKYVISSRKKISELGLKNSSAKMLPGKETILFTSRAKIGEIAILVEDGCTSQGFQSWIIDSKRVNIEFLYYLGKNLKKQAIRKASGSTFLEISNHDVKKLKLKV